MRITAPAARVRLPGRSRAGRNGDPDHRAAPGQAEEGLYASFGEGAVLRRAASCAVSPASWTQNSDGLGAGGGSP